MVGALDGAPAAPSADTASDAVHVPQTSIEPEPASGASQDAPAPDAAATPATPPPPPVDPEKEIAAEISAAQARLAELGDPNAVAKAASDLLAKANQDLLDKSRELELAVYRARDHMRTTREKVQMDLEEKRLLLIRIGHLEAEAESIKAAKAAAEAAAKAEGDA